MDMVLKLKSLIYLRLLDLMAEFENKFIALSLQKILTYFSKLRQFKLILPLRLLIQFVLPNRPITTDSPPTIELLVACTITDKEKLKISVASAKRNSQNEISQIRIICPARDLSTLKSEFPDFIFETDEETLGTDIFEFIRETFPANLHGWITQQCVKYLAVLNSSFEAVLILDADTVLLKPLTFIDAAENQILSISYEYHSPYANHAKQMWGNKASSAVSYVTHYQLQQKKFLFEMFPEKQHSIQKWLELADSSQNSAISEYHCYGAWASQVKSNNIRWHKWNNRAIAFNKFEKLSSPQLTLDALTKDFPRVTSLSFHGYL